MKNKLLLIIFLAFLIIPFGVSALTITEKIRTAYRDILNREPSSSEIIRAQSRFRGFNSLKSQLNSLSERDTVIINIYQRALKRNPRVDELQTLKKFVAPNNLIRKQLYESRERELAIRDLYLGLLGREPRDDSLRFYVRTRSPFTKIKDVLNLSNERKQAIQKKFVNRLGRAPSQQEQTMFISGLVYVDRIGKAGLPIAHAGNDIQTTSDKKTVELDASQSISFKGDDLLYTWTLLSSPNSKQSLVKSVSTSIYKAPLLSSNILSSYTMSGVYKWMLQVSDTVGTSKSDEVVITIKPETQAEAGLLKLVNEMRKEKNLKSLVFDTKLLWASRKYAKYLLDNDWFEHTDKQGRTFVDRVNAENYDYLVVGENLGVIKSNVDDLVTGRKTENNFFAEYWRNSPAHYKNIMTDEFTQTGIGFAVGKTQDSKFPFKLFVVQEFGNSL